MRSFQRLKRDTSIVNKQVSLEHLTNLNERLDIIMHSSEERGRFLEFEELRWKVQKFYVQLEFFIMELNKKQGDVDHTEKLYDEFNVYKNANLKNEWIISFCYFREKFMKKNFQILSKIYFRN